MFLNGTWPQWVSNVANVVRSAGRSLLSSGGSPGPHGPAAPSPVTAWSLACSASLALPLPARDRERFVGKVRANLADRRRWWQRVEELLSVAAAVPGLAVILRWARRRA